MINDMFMADSSIANRSVDDRFVDDWFAADMFMAEYMFCGGAFVAENRGVERGLTFVAWLVRAQAKHIRLRRSAQARLITILVAHWINHSARYRRFKQERIDTRRD